MVTEKKQGFAGVVEAIVNWLQGGTESGTTSKNSSSDEVVERKLNTSHAVVAKSLQTGKLTTSINVLRNPPKAVPRPASPAEVGTFKPASSKTEEEEQTAKSQKKPSSSALK